MSRKRGYSQRGFPLASQDPELMTPGVAETGWVFSWFSFERHKGSNEGSPILGS